MTTLLVVLALVGLLFLVTIFFGAPYIPSHRKDIVSVFKDLRPVNESDTVLDLGGGDGAVCLEAAKIGAKSINYEINPLLLLVSAFRMRRYRLLYRWRLVNYLKVSFPGDVTVVYAFSESAHISGVYKKIKKEADRQQRSLDFISYGFEVPGVGYDKRNNTHFLYHIEPLLT